MASYYLSFDDTDNLETLGTGHLLQDFLEQMEGQWRFISRHQLFVDPMVPYTSHNSAMCVELVSDIGREALIQQASDYLCSHAAPGSDPGLCVAEKDALCTAEALVLWGYRAKREVLDQAAAYALAKKCGVHLSAHGGTGQGVVGALAAVGLRLGGQDGRVKGKVRVDADVLSVETLLQRTGFDRVCAYGEGVLPQDATLIIPPDHLVKAVYQNHQSTVLAVREQKGYRLLTKDALKCF